MSGSVKSFKKRFIESLSSWVNDISVQPDGKILVGGRISLWDGVSVSNFIRLNSDYTIDTTFRTNVGSTFAGGAAVSNITLQNDGKILVGGAFTSRFLRLNSDGTLDTAFNSNIGTVPNSGISRTAIQPDGKIIAVGGFTTWGGVTNINRIVRLNPDGTRDTAFSTVVGTAANNSCNAVALQADGKIIVVGAFTTWNGVTANRIVRLNSDGTLDTAFNTNIGTGATSPSGSVIVYDVKIQSNNKIIIGGNFPVFNSKYCGYMVRINTDGTRDTLFDTNVGTGAVDYTNSRINSIDITSEDKIIVGGNFENWNNVKSPCVALLSSEGILDNSFSENLSFDEYAQGVLCVRKNLDNTFFVGGPFTYAGKKPSSGFAKLNNSGLNDLNFTTSQINQILRYSVKVNSFWKTSKSSYCKVDGSWRQSFLEGGYNDSSFAPQDNVAFFNNAVRTIFKQPDGKLLVGGSFQNSKDTVSSIVRLNLDDSNDNIFSNNVNVRDSLFDSGFNQQINKISMLSNNKIIVISSSGWNARTYSEVSFLNNDGLKDYSLNKNIGTGASTAPTTLQVQPDDKIILGGTFTTWNGVTANRIVRLNSDGTLDTAFSANTGTGANASISEVLLQPDGKILVIGTFTTWNNVNANRIVRLNSDGTRDTAFDTGIGTGPSATLSGIAVQSDGKILVGGLFTLWNDAAANRIIRLNPNGTTDTAFSTNVGTGPSSTVITMEILSDGRIIVGGDFATWGGVTSSRIALINSNGTLDTTFSANTGAGAAGGSVLKVLFNNNKIYVGGTFQSWNNNSNLRNFIVLNLDGTLSSSPINQINTGANNQINSVFINQTDKSIFIGGAFNAFGNIAVPRFAKLNLNGELDLSFNTNIGAGPSSSISALMAQPDGKIIVGGAFTTWNGVTVNRIARINSDGTRDTAFTTAVGANGANGTVSAIAIQSDGKIILGGDFTTWNGVTVNRIVRLNPDGTRDTAFTTAVGTATGSTASQFVNVITIQNDGKIIVGGAFTTWNGATVGRMVRLNSDGTRENAFNTNISSGASSAITSFAIQPDNKILVGGNFQSFSGNPNRSHLTRLLETGAHDTTFAASITYNASNVISAIHVQPDGKIIAGGNFNLANSATRIFRVNNFGVRDFGFNFSDNARIETRSLGTSSIVTTIVPHLENKVIVAGRFNFIGFSIRNNIARIGTDNSPNLLF